MTPAVKAAEKAAIAFHLRSYEAAESDLPYAEEAAHALGVSPERVFKTLVVALNDNPATLAAAMLPASARLDLKALASAAKAKKASLAAAEVAERATGYVVGGISPLGQRKRLPAFIDASVQEQSSVFVSAGRRGLQMELAPEALLRATGAQLAALTR